MGAVRFLARAELRRRRASVLLLALLVGLVGAVVLASAAGARRSASSLRRFEDASRSADVEIDAGETTPAEIARFRRAKVVAAAGALRQMTLVYPDSPQFLAVGGPIDDVFGRDVDRPRLIAGREARAVDEIDVGEELAKQLRAHVGSVVHFHSYTPEQVRTEDGSTEPAGPAVALRIAGIVRRPLDIGGRGATGGVIVLTPAFIDRYRDRIGSITTILRVRTRNGQRDVPAAITAARRIWGHSDNFNSTTLAIEGETAQHAIDVTTVGLWLLSGVAAAAGLVAIAIALARYVAPRATEDDSLRAIGARRSQRWAASAATVLPVALGGAVVAVVAAVLASPLFPVGVARQAEPDPGLHGDGLVIGAGFVGLVLVVAAIGGLAAWVATRRATRRAARPGAATEALARAGSPPTMATGIGFALEQRGERSGVPVRAALAGAVVGVLGVVAVATYASSLDRLASTPARYGWTWDLAGIDATQSSAPCTSTRTGLTSKRLIDAVGVICLGNVEVDGHPVNANAYVPVRGAPIRAEIVDGRSPRRANEVALGHDAMDATGKGIGDVVRVQGNASSARFRIVGQAVFPSIIDTVPLTDGATFTRRGLRSLRAVSDGYYLFRIAPGVDRAEAVAAVRRLGGGRFPPIGPVVPAEVDRLRQVDFLVPVLGGFIAVVALVAIGYTLVVAVRRRRHDLAILKTIGFDRRQVRAAVAWQATTLATLGLVVGIPLGLLAGRVFWGLVADNLGVADSIAVSRWALVVIVAGALIVTNAIAAFPARTAARIPAAVVLRTE